MQYEVFVKNIAENSYVASIIGMPDCVAEGQTEEEAVNRARSELEELLAQGKVVTIEVENHREVKNPLLKHAGRFKDDPTFDDFLAEIERYRRELDAEESNQ